MTCAGKTFRAALAVGCIAGLLVIPAWPAKRQKPPAEPPWPELFLEAGRKLTYQQTFASERDVRTNPGFWGKLANVVLGERDYKPLGRPYGIAVDSKGRMIVTDPALGGVHIFDISQRKYKFIQRFEKSKDEMIEPQCVAVDNKDNIYVTDSKVGKVFVFDPSGKTRRVFGSIKGGEGYFKRPTGIAIDSENQRVYVTDTLRDRVYVLNFDGQVLSFFGKHGAGNGEFNLPTEVHVKNGIVAVVDAMNFRVQLFDVEGNFKGQIGATGNPKGDIYRPKGIAIDSEDHIYLVEGEWGLVQVFDREGRLLYHFGNGTGFGRFRLPSGLFIDKNDRIYLVDTYNRRVQIFQYQAFKQGAQGVQQ
jgi:DNA-binding beta-propeller fold protein YncE